MEIWHTQGRKGLYIYRLGWMLQTPNPANPNVQDQNADAVQGPTNLAQGPMVQNQAQGPTFPQFKTQLRVPQIRIRLKSLQFKFQFKSLQVQFQLKVPHRLVKIYLSNHYNNQSPYNWPLLVL